MRPDHVMQVRRHGKHAQFVPITGVFRLGAAQAHQHNVGALTQRRQRSLPRAVDTTALADPITTVEVWLQLKVSAAPEHLRRAGDEALAQVNVPEGKQAVGAQRSISQSNRVLWQRPA